jgi:hypothetical protein
MACAPRWIADGMGILRTKGICVSRAKRVRIRRVHLEGSEPALEYGRRALPKSPNHVLWWHSEWTNVGMHAREGMARLLGLMYVCCRTFGRALLSWRPNPSGGTMFKTFSKGYGPDLPQSGFSTGLAMFVYTLLRIRIMNTQLRPRSLAVHREQAIKLGIDTY